MREVKYIEKYHDIIYRVIQKGVMLDLVFFTIMICCILFMMRAPKINHDCEKKTDLVRRPFLLTM
jgi:hypothetical protein